VQKAYDDLKDLVTKIRLLFWTALPIVGRGVERFLLRLASASRCTLVARSLVSELSVGNAWAP